MVKDVLDRCFDERTTAAGWIEYSLAQGGVNYGFSDFLRQPAGCVVLTQALSFFLRDHVLVKRGPYLFRVLRPIKPFHDTGDFAEVRAFSHLRGPGEQVSVDDTVQVGLFGQDVSLEQGVRPFGGVVGHVAQQLLLHDDGDQAGDVGVPDEQPVTFVSGGGSVLAQRNLQQVLPEPSFQGHCRVVAVRFVGFLQQQVAG